MLRNSINGTRRLYITFTLFYIILHYFIKLLHYFFLQDSFKFQRYINKKQWYYHWNKDIGQWHRILSLEIDSRIYGQLIFIKGIKNTLDGVSTVQQMVRRTGYPYIWENIYWSLPIVPVQRFWNFVILWMIRALGTSLVLILGLWPQFLTQVSWNTCKSPGWLECFSF